MKFKIILTTCFTLFQTESKNTSTAATIQINCDNLILFFFFYLKSMRKFTTLVLIP